MTPADDLAEVASRAENAAIAVRSADWSDRTAVRATLRKLSLELHRELDLLRSGRPLTGEPSPIWADRTDRLIADLEEQLGTGQRASPSAAQSGTSASELPAVDEHAMADAESAATIARIALRQAEIAAVLARLAELDLPDAGPTGPDGGRIGSSVLHHPVAIRSVAAFGGAKDELVHIAKGRPRTLAIRLAVSLGLGLGYLIFFAIFLWDPDQHERYFLALYAFSGIAGSAVCTNALSLDAARVRAMLEAGRPLWHVMVTKNAALFAIIGALGMTMNLILFWVNGDGTELIKATGVLVTMMLLWFGVGNVLSVFSPLRAEPLSARRHDGTLRPFLVSFVVSYGLSYLVNLMLYWRVWAKQTLLERLGGPWIPVLLIVGSAAGAYLLLTVLSLAVVQQPRYRRGLQREMVVYRGTEAS